MIVRLMLSKETKINIPINFFCNQKCFFCSEWDKADQQFIKDTDFSYVYDMLREGLTETESVIFTSWEPTLNNKLFDFIQKAKDYGYKNIGIITNGSTLHKSDILQKLKESSLTEITVSIHWSNSIIHDYNTWITGSFNKALLGLILLKRQSLRINIFLSFVLNRYNLSDLYRFILKFDRIGVQKLLVNTMRPEWYWKTRIKELSVKYNDIIKEFQGFSSKQLSYINVLIKQERLIFMDIPICILKKSGIHISAYWKVENRIIFDAWEIRKIDNINYSELNEENGKVYLSCCEKCTFKSSCEGIYYDYLAAFWNSEFVDNFVDNYE